MSTRVMAEHRRGAFTLAVDLHLPDAGVTALYGPSGAGKSTLVDIVSGLLAPVRGQVVVRDEVVLDTAEGIFVPPAKRRFGYVFQDARLFPHLSVRSNLMFGRKRAAQPMAEEQERRIVEMLGLAHLLERRPHQLSGGERQRVALGRALLASPKLLLLDEPLAGVDASRKHEILPYLERLRDEARLPMLLVSHALDEVSRLADEVVVIENGRVTGQGSVHEILARSDLGVIAASNDAGAVIETQVVHQHREVELTELVFEGHRLLVPRLHQAVGARARVHIRALDVTLALDEPKNISANNVWTATVTAVHHRDGAQADVQLACGSATLLARITRYSVERLGLHAGCAVYAIIKSVTVDRGEASADR